MRKSASASLVLLSLLLAPRTALAQASITGTVRDTSSGVLPGVTVKVSSPVLIAKVRTVTTDGAGLYLIVDLRPGEYTVSSSAVRGGCSNKDG